MPARSTPLPPPPAAFRGVVGSFAEEDRLLAGSDLATAAGLRFEAFLPTGDEELLRRLRPRSPKSGTRFWTLLGGIGGGVAAMAMTIWTMRNWPLVVGGKPIVSWPPFIQVIFEWTVLVASFMCMTGFFILSGLPNLYIHPAYLPEFQVDRFGLFLPCSRSEEALVRALLARAGAETIQAVFDRGQGRLAPPNGEPPSEPWSEPPA